MPILAQVHLVFDKLEKENIMKRFDMRIIFGFVLIFAGSMFLLQNLGIFYGGTDLLVSILLGSVGGAALYVYANNRENWWALIPGFTLIGVALNIVLDVISSTLGNMFGGAIVLGGIALSFWMIFFTKRNSFWWAVIPAGVLSSVAVQEILENVMPTDGIFMLGLGLTFLFIARLPGYEDNLKWAYIPGGIILAIGVIQLSFVQSVMNILLPLALIGAGGYVIYKNFKN